MTTRTSIATLPDSEPAKSAADERRRRFRITLCPTEFGRFAAAMTGGPADATDIIQRYLARFLSARGHDLTFFAPRDGQRSVTTKVIEAATPSRASWTANPLFTLAEKVCWRVQRAVGIPYLNEFSQYRIEDEARQALASADVVYERSYLYRDGISRACKRSKTPYVLFVESDEILEYDYRGVGLSGLQRRRAEKAFRRNLENADCILCVSSQLRAHLAERWDVPLSRMLVFQNAVDLERFRPDPEGGAEIRSTLGIGAAPLLVFVGNFYRWHDVPALLEAYRGVLQSRPDARLVLVGDGSERAAMEERARSLGVAEQSIFTGRVPHEDVPKYLAAADVAVAPYPKMDREMWLSPLKVYESMAAGAPVVASSAGQLADLIAHRETGLLVPVGDDDAFGAAIEELLARSDLRDAISQRAREHIVRHHSWERYIERLEAVLEAVVSKRPFTGLGG